MTRFLKVMMTIIVMFGILNLVAAFGSPSGARLAQARDQAIDHQSAVVIFHEDFLSLEKAVLDPEKIKDYKSPDTETVKLSASVDSLKVYRGHPEWLQLHLADLAWVNKYLVHDADLYASRYGMTKLALVESLTGIAVKNPDGFKEYKFNDLVNLPAGELIEKLPTDLGSRDNSSQGYLFVYRVVTPESPNNGLVFVLEPKQAEKIINDFHRLVSIYSSDYSNSIQLDKEMRDSVECQKAALRKILTP